MMFKANDSGEAHFLEQLDKNCLAPAMLELKAGAQVSLYGQTMELRLVLKWGTCQTLKPSRCGHVAR